jgi:hypothetical protein
MRSIRIILIAYAFWWGLCLPIAHAHPDSDHHCHVTNTARCH